MYTNICGFILAHLSQNLVFAWAEYCPLTSELRISSCEMKISNSLYPQDYVSLLQASDNTDIAAKLISDGLLRAETRREKKVAKLVRIILHSSCAAWQ